VSAPELERFRAAYLRNSELLNQGAQEEAFVWVPEAFEWHVLADALPDDVRIEALQYFEVVRRSSHTSES
jgi:hypothetical protein